MAKKLVKLERWLEQWKLSFMPVDPREGEAEAYELIRPGTEDVLARFHQKPNSPMVHWEGLWNEHAGSGAQRSFVAAAEEALYCFGFASKHIGNLKRSGGEW